MLAKFTQMLDKLVKIVTTTFTFLPIPLLLISKTCKMMAYETKNVIFSILVDDNMHL